MQVVHFAMTGSSEYDKYLVIPAQAGIHAVMAVGSVTAHTVVCEEILSKVNAECISTY